MIYFHFRSSLLVIRAQALRCAVSKGVGHVLATLHHDKACQAGVVLRFARWHSLRFLPSQAFVEWLADIVPFLLLLAGVFIFKHAGGEHWEKEKGHTSSHSEGEGALLCTLRPQGRGTGATLHCVHREGGRALLCTLRLQASATDFRMVFLANVSTFSAPSHMRAASHILSSDVPHRFKVRSCRPKASPTLHHLLVSGKYFSPNPLNHALVESNILFSIRFLSHLPVADLMLISFLTACIGNGNADIRKLIALRRKARVSTCMLQAIIVASFTCAAVFVTLPNPSVLRVLTMRTILAASVSVLRELGTQPCACVVDMHLCA